MVRSFRLFFSLSITLVCLYISPVHAQEATSQTGTILESMNASGYTYLHLDTKKEQLWVAIPSTVVNKGEEVTFLSGMVMQNFHSKTLNRTFPEIIFSKGLEGMKSNNIHGGSTTKTSANSSFADAVKSEANRVSAPASPQVSGGSTGAMVPYVEAQVEKAPGSNSYSIGEIFTKAQDLNGQLVRVKGKVVKFSPNIMGKNWIHIQDGSGDPMKNTHDLVITTADQANPDEIIIVEGKMTANKDFGSGYKYDALLEKSRIIRQSTGQVPE